MTFLEEAGETRTLLFATGSGGVRPLGYALERPTWQGRVVGYQPGEYQPNALDDLEGPNLQVLVNAVLWASGYDPDAGGSGSLGSSSSGGVGSGAGGTLSSSSSGPTGSFTASGGLPGGGVGGELTTSSGGGPSSGGQPDGGAVRGDANSGSTTGAPLGSGGAGTADSGAPRSGGCSLTPHSAPGRPRALLTLMLGLLVTGSLLRRARQLSLMR